MSTFFRSAAMTLLSKTLQTLLYKYLSDVDVEGVALPSLYNSDGQDSGWGVRLSNVKLREGAKLMDLPGAPRDASSRRHKKTRKKGTKTGSADHSPERSTDATIQDGKEGLDAGQQRRETMQQCADTENGTDCNDSGDQHKDRSADVEEAETATASSIASNQRSQEESAVNKKSSGWFSWGSCRSSKHKSPPEHSSSYLSDDDDVVGEPYDKEENPMPSPSSAQQINDDKMNSKLSEDISKGTSPIIQTEEQGSTGEQVAAQLEKREEQEEEDSDDVDGLQEEKMMLRLGRGGRIGSLDVRLIGKDIHVLVEDADLTVEAVRVIEKPADDSATPDADSEKETKPPPPASKASGESTSSKKKRDEPKTVGERVLAEIPLARVFSVIPNLFLRDIQVRFVVRDKAEYSNEEKQQEGDSTASKEEYGVEDSVVELGIEFLSVTDGEDFLASFRAPPEDENANGDDGSDSAEEGAGGPDDDQFWDPRYASSHGINASQNEYLTKRIRTGRGIEGGISLRIYPPGRTVPAAKDLDRRKPVWSRDRWMSDTEYCFARVSGLDLRARIYLGTKKEIAIINNTWYGDEEEYYGDEFAVDSLLFGGVDYIAPGPQPPLPPMSDERVAVAPPRSTEDQLWTRRAATAYRVDANGIQSCAVSSSFHRVARGLSPTVSDKVHLPCECCEHCWAALPGIEREHALDKSMPLGGLVLDISMRDPLEVNIDRPALELIGEIIRLFKKKQIPPQETLSASADSSSPAFADNTNIDLEGSERSRAFARGSSHPMDDSTRTDPSLTTASNSSTLHRSSSHPEVSQRRGSSRRSLDMKEGSRHKTGPESRQNRHHLDHPDKNLATSFPEYMQPEKIQMLGVHVSDLVVRMHIMRGNSVIDTGLGYCYWDIHAKCITMDYQGLSAPEKVFQDVRIDVGHFVATEFQGVSSTQLLCLGVRHEVIDFDEATVETLMAREEGCERPPWPSSAAALLEVPPPLETLVYESRERHALQLRYISVGDPGDAEEFRKSANLQVGVAHVDVSSSIPNQISTVISEAKSCILGPPEEKPETIDSASLKTDSKEEPKTVDTLLKYKLQLDGGRISYHPLVNVRLPLTVLRGEKSTEYGFSFETVLEHVGVKFRSATPARAVEKGGLSLVQLAGLPENVRLRVLLFLKDLKPLESALALKPESNPFMRCRAVNKGISKMAKKIAKSSAKATHRRIGEADSVSVRQHIMKDLMKLDDDELEALWVAHQRTQRKAAKMRSSNGC